MLTPTQQHEIRRKLTFTVKQEYGEDKIIKAWRESPNTFYVPRFYKEAPSKLPEGTAIDVVFHGSIRPDQQKAIDAYLPKQCGLLELPCGFGKTIVALHLIHKIGRKTLVIVH
jgi:superfamily II DNA or RNA helicase